MEEFGGKLKCNSEVHFTQEFYIFGSLKRNKLVTAMYGNYSTIY